MQLCGSPVSPLEPDAPANSAEAAPPAAFATAQREGDGAGPERTLDRPSNSSIRSHCSGAHAAVSRSQSVRFTARFSQTPQPTGLKARFSSRRYQAPGRRPGMRSVRLWSQLSRQSSVVRAPNRVRPGTRAPGSRSRAAPPARPGTAARRSRPPGRIVPASQGRHGTLAPAVASAQVFAVFEAHVLGTRKSRVSVI